MAHQWLIDDYARKMEAAGIKPDKARVLARLAAELEENQTLWNKITQEGFEGFCRWIEIKCKNIYEDIKYALNAVWEFFKSWF